MFPQFELKSAYLSNFFAIFSAILEMFNWNINIIIIGLCSVICGGEDFVDMEDFGKEREEFLRKFLELPNGIPDSDTFKRVFEKLNPEKLSECLVNWIKIELPERCVIAVDVKTIRDSQNKEHNHASEQC